MVVYVPVSTIHTILLKGGKRMAFLSTKHLFAVSLLISFSLYAEQPAEKNEPQLPAWLKKQVEITGKALSEEEIFFFGQIAKVGQFKAKINDEEVTVKIVTKEKIAMKASFYIEQPSDEKKAPTRVKIKCKKEEENTKVVCKGTLNRQAFKEMADTAKMQYDLEEAAAQRILMARLNEQL